ncbi:Hsp70 family protein [Corynebacterium sp. A21]|uniref:Hsp70 family protein n=1 Tax=Corynebacterium sp. A21 TaxID=3457318 RepID=UPI003FD18396
MSETWNLAIDFGTSNTAAAHTAPLSGTVETLALSHRGNLMPSAVHTDSGAGHLLSGDTALSKGRRDPARLVPSPKRYIDHDVIQLAGADVPVVEVIATVLRSVIERGMAQHAGTRPATVTLTHPEAWSVHSVGQLVAAAEAAEIAAADIRLISEPRAAAIHYAAQRSIPQGGHVAVFDFGGGTLDIAVLRAQDNGNFEVVATKGDNSLGGRTIDNLLFRWVIEQVGHDDPDLSDYLRSAPISVMHSLELNIREAKEILSDTSSATITVSTPKGESDLLLTREEFNQIIDSSVQRGCELTSAALEQAGVDTSQTPIYMTGGSSRIPHVQNRLAEVGSVMTLDDPKTVVSRGALTATIMNFSLRAEAVVASGGNRRDASAAAAAAGALGGAAAAQNPFAQGAPNQNAAAADPTPQENPFAQAHGGTSPSQPHPETRAEPVPAGAGAGVGAAAAASGPSTSSFEQGPNKGEYKGPSSHSPAAPSSKGTAGGGAKLPLLIGGAVVAMAVVGGGIWFATSDRGAEAGENTAAETSTAASGAPESAEPNTSSAPSTAATAAAGAGGEATVAESGLLAEATTTKTNSDMFQTVGTLFPGSESFLPSAVLANMENCDTAADNFWRFGMGGAAYAGDSQATTHSCLGSEATEAVQESMGMEGVLYTSLDLQQGEDATVIYDLARDPGQTIEEFQDAGDGRPHVFRSGEGDDPGVMVVYYPDEEFLVLGSVGIGNEQHAEQWARDYGFLV